MTSIQQRAELQRRIWQIANDVRGAVDGWDFKQYVLGALFYRFISENFASYIEGGDDSVNYAELPDNVITPDIKDDAIKTKGYFIYPSQLFAKVAASANTNESLNTDLAANVDHFAQSVPFEKVAANDYNLSVSSYVEARDNREVVDIAQLNAELKTTVARIDQLRKDIDAIVAEIEGEDSPPLEGCPKGGVVA